MHAGPTRRARSATFCVCRSQQSTRTAAARSSGAILRGKFTDSIGDETEWCERRLLARIHRLTIGTLRKQIEPVTPAQFMRWLLRWQHVAPGSQLLGERGTLEVLQQLQGFEAPANAWERQILARRVAGYDPKVLDQLVPHRRGRAGDGFRRIPRRSKLSTVEGRRVIPTSVAPITFFVREDSDWMIPRRKPEEEAQGLSPAASEACVISAPARRVVFRGYRSRHGQTESGSGNRAVGTGRGRNDHRRRLRQSARADRSEAALLATARDARPGRATAPAGGRCCIPTRPSIARALSNATCWMLLRRYGVVFREVLTRETILPRWREVLIALRRLEDRGEMRGGRFVSGFLGEQFALPIALESLRAMRGLPPDGETITLSSADPLNFVGILVPGERVSASSGKLVAFRDGVALPMDEHSNVTSITAAISSRAG